MKRKMNTLPSIPVIINESLKSRSICEFMARFPHLKIRHSTSTLPETCIFPTSSVAFLLFQVDEANQENFPERIQSFSAVHQRAFAVCIIDLDYPRAAHQVSSFQLRCLPTSHYLMVVSGWSEAVDAMVATAKAHTPSVLTNLNTSLAKFVEDSVSEVTVTTVMGSLGLSTQESGILLDGFGSAANIVTKVSEHSQEHGVDKRTMSRLEDYFSKDFH